MEQYPSNSNKAKEEAKEKKKIEKAITGTAKVKKKSDARKFADVFLSEDMDKVKSYIFLDTIVPTIKRALVDIIKNSVDTLFYGEVDHSTRSTGASKVSYRSYYNKPEETRASRYSTRVTTSYDYDDIIIDNRGEAEDILTRMDELVATYGMVSVADFYDLVGVTCNYTDNKYGWTDIRTASVVRTRNGYMIKLPKAMPLN